MRVGSSSALFGALLASGAASALAAPALQIPFDASPSSSSSVEQHNGYELASVDPFPDHRLRMRTPKGLCDPAVKQKSGYLDTKRGHHFYWWMFESRNDPVNDPVVLWLNGGPGCSSFTGLLQELGPCRIQPIGQDPVRNPWSWNENATFIFLDQPVGVGYSYADNGDAGVWSTEEAAKDVYAFLHIWFHAFKDTFGTNSFHLAGESFCGRYLPVFADYIVEQNKLGKHRAINLDSVLIGNGFTDAAHQYPTYYPTVCTNVTGYGPYVNETACESMKATLPTCERLVKECFDTLASSACIAAKTYCEDTQTQPYYDTGRNAYDMRRFGEYAEEAQVAYWLNRDDVRHELGVDHEKDGGVKQFIGCSDDVGFRFSATGDTAKPSFQHIANVLEANVSVLIYAGDADFICNYLGNSAWTLALEWSQKEDFNAQPLRPWFATELDRKLDQPAGQVRQAGPLAFATIYESGHFVPYDKGAESLSMFTNWVHYGTLDGLK